MSTIKAVVRKGEQQYVVECMELPIVTQGRTMDEAIANLREAVSLHLEGEDLDELGLRRPFSLLVLYETDLADAA